MIHARQEAQAFLQSLDDNSFKEERARQLLDSINKAFGLPDSMKIEFARQMLYVFESTKIIDSQPISIGRILFVNLWKCIETNSNISARDLLFTLLHCFSPLLHFNQVLLSIFARLSGTSLATTFENTTNSMDSKTREIIINIKKSCEILCKP